MQDNFNRLERKRDLLLRENEKLKNDNKIQRRTFLGNSNMGGLNVSRNMDVSQHKPGLSNFNINAQSMIRDSEHLKKNHFLDENKNDVVENLISRLQQNMDQ